VGNILLTKTENRLLRGFITDLEFARIENPTFSKPQVTVTRNIGPQNKYDDRLHVVARTQPTTRTHTTFESMVTGKRGAGMTVSYLDAESFSTLKAFHREQPSSWPGKYCHRKSRPPNVSCTKQHMTSNPLYGYSHIASCATSTIGHPIDPHQKTSRTSPLLFDLCSANLSANRPSAPSPM